MRTELWPQSGCKWIFANRHDEDLRLQCPLLPVSAGAQDHPLPSLQSPQGLPSLECVSKWRHSGGLMNDSVQEELEIKRLDTSPEDCC